MYVPNELLGSQMKVLVNERRQPEADRQNKRSLCRFEEGDDAKPAF